MLGLLTVIAAAAGAWWAFRAPPTVVEEMLPLVGDVAVAVPSTTTQAPAPLVVHVDGAVAEPGVHHVVLGSRVVDAIEAGDFNVYAIETIDQALALLMEGDSGDFENGDYTEGSILYIAQQRAHEFWETARASQSPPTE